MKKLIFLLIVSVFLSGCGCVLSQIPPQYIIAGDSCKAVLPSYLNRVHATDNCVLASLIQTPAPGTILSPLNNVIRVTIKATDNVGNSSQIDFDVFLIDTIPPVITVDDTLMTSDMDMIRALYDQADRIILSKLETYDANFPYDELGIPKTDSALYKEYFTMIRTPLKGTGEVKRIFSLWIPNDTIP